MTLDDEKSLPPCCRELWNLLIRNELETLLSKRAEPYEKREFIVADIPRKSEQVTPDDSGDSEGRGEWELGFA